MWVLIAIVAIGVIALVSDVEVKVEVGTEDYVDWSECELREMRQCPSGDNMCDGAAEDYCEKLFPE